MERLKSEDVGVINQKENDPSLARDENAITYVHQEITNSDTKVTLAHHAPFEGSQCALPQQPLKARNASIQSQNQTQLLEKFRKLRLWQQQQQQSMLRQQQQSMETLKMEQSQLQAILAAQRSLHDQQTTSRQIVQSASSQDIGKRASAGLLQSKPQQFPNMPVSVNTTTRTADAVDDRERVGQISSDPFGATFSPNIPTMVMVQGELPSQIPETGSGTRAPQYKVPEDERLEESIASFNTTLYPMMWNSSNYRLPIGAIPLPAVTQPLQGNKVLGALNIFRPMSYPGMKSKEILDVAQSCQTPNLGKELSPGTDIQTNLGIQEKLDHNKGNSDPVTTQQHPQCDKVGNCDPGAQLLASVETDFDEQSEADAMSGVYPLYDSEFEKDPNETDDTEMDEEEVEDNNNYDEAEFEESNARETTVIDLHDSDSVRKNDGLDEESKDEIDDEARPIKPGIGEGSSVKTFEELLEQQLKCDEASKPEAESQASPQRPQRTFLRKGQGLARFKGKSASNKTVGQPQRPTGQSVVAPQKKERKTGYPFLSNSSQENKTPTVPIGGAVMQSRVTRKIASKSPQVPTGVTDKTTFSKGKQSKESIAPKTQAPSGRGKAVLPDKPKPVTQSAFSRAESTGNPPGLFNSIDASFQMRLQELEEKQEIEEEELEEFELLEQAAANASFSSNSSVVVRVLAKARGNAQGGKRFGQEQSAVNKKSPGGMPRLVDTGYGRGDGKVNSSADHPDPELSDHDSDSEGSDITLKEMTLDSVLEVESGDENSNQANLNKWGKVSSHFNPNSSPSLDNDFNDEEAWGEIKKQAKGIAKNMENGDDDDFNDDDDDDSDVTISDIFPLVTSTPPVRQKGSNTARLDQVLENEGDGVMASTPPTSSLVTKLFPQLKPKVKANQQSGRKQPANDAPQNRTGDEKKDDSPVEAVQSVAVRQKLKELETEIEKFRSENAALAKMRAEREEVLKKLQNEIDAFQKQKTEELERLEQFKEEELRKLRRERRVFEKYQKAARAMPDKKERDEIEALRAQVAELQEELKRRESRWSAASTRSRQRIEVLERENQELQDEIKLLERYRLQQWREDEQAREEEDSRLKRPLQRKIAKTMEEASSESGTLPPSSHRSPPLIPDLLEPLSGSNPDSTVFESGSRLSAGGTDSNDNHSGRLQQDENPLSDSRSKLNEAVRSEADAMNRAESNNVCDTQQSKRSPRQRSKTPDGSDRSRGKRNVHFQDESPPLCSSSVDEASPSERTEKQDQREIMHSDGKVEKVNSDGSRVISFANGTRKEISADGKTVIVAFFNGDVKQIMPDQRVIYYYSEAQTTHTTYPDGLEVLQFPSKQIEKHYPDGTKEITFPDETIKYLHPNGAEECVFSDGTIQKVNKDGERTIEFPNGQRETHTKYYKKREYPDGTVKTVYPDGRTQTCYSTGRVRVKDRDGRVLVDSSNEVR
ncbi:centromere protein J-like isoform X3 [Montipora capricornis]|uniref:centromere protein J-like isoform X3 n=1 Tax=Montipora capricornis TaxID=246305 RepID=UPI0035F13162